MSGVLLVLLGAMLVLLVLSDLVTTTLSVGTTGGLYSGKLNGWLWRRALRLLGRSHTALRRAGVAAVILPVATWVAGLLTGWSLVFLGAGPQAILRSPGGEPADAWGRVYYAGFTLSTLGVGDLRPQGVAWQFATVLAAVTGLVAVTLGISYLVPVIRSGVEKRTAASDITGLGLDAHDILRSTWDGRSFAPLQIHLLPLTSSLNLIAQQHLAYPVLHYFHSPSRETALAPKVAALDEALTLVAEGCQAPGVDEATLRRARRAVGQLLLTLKSSFIEANPQPPPGPTLEGLRRLGAPTVPDSEFVAAVDRLVDRRRLLLAFVESDGWDWQDDVMAPQQDSLLLLEPNREAPAEEA